MNRRTFLKKSLSVYLLSIGLSKINGIKVFQSYENEFKRCLLEDHKNTPSIYRGQADNRTMSDFHPDHDYGNATITNLDEINEKNKFVVQILADNCALAIPKEFRPKVNFVKTNEMVCWLYRGQK